MCDSVCVVLVVLRDAVAVKKGYQFHLLRVCVQKKNNHKKAHQRLIEKSLVATSSPPRRPQTTPAPVITSPVARRSHQLALEAVALIAFAQPGQASQAALLPTPLPYALPMVYSNFTTLNCNILKSKSNHTSDFYVVCRGQLLNYSIIFLFIIRT